MRMSLLARIGTAVSSLTVVLALGTATAPVAVADGLHLLPKEWTLGCAINYWMDARTEADYGPNIEAGLASLHTATGFGFTKLAYGDTRASIRYVVVDTIAGGYAGLAFSNGDIQLLQAAGLSQSPDPALNSMVRDEIVIHETLHVLGLDHDLDVGSNPPDEMMYTQGSWGQLHFGEGDREGMAHVSAQNGCVPPDPNAQPVPAMPLTVRPTVTSTPAPQTDAAASTTTAAKPSATTPTTPTTPTTQARAEKPRRPSALQKCLAAQGFRAHIKGHYCPPLKHEVYVSPGQAIGSHRRVSSGG